MRRFAVAAALAAVVLGTMVAGAAQSAATGRATGAARTPEIGKAVFFAADGLRQDIVARYAEQGLLPTMSEFLKKGTSASGNGRTP